MHAIKRGMQPWAWMNGVTLVAIAFMAIADPGHAQAQALGAASLRIESVPSAAEVELIGGYAGTTPLVITERDIYPNDYPDARADMYGIVVLRHAGCAQLRHRVVLSDLKQGLRLDLDCGAAMAQSHAPEVPPDKPPLAAPPPLQQQGPTSQRRLRQLQVLQELLDEGLISPAEEQRVRRRILQSGDVPLD